MAFMGMTETDKNITPKPKLLQLFTSYIILAVSGNNDFNIPLSPKAYILYPSLIQEAFCNSHPTSFIIVFGTFVFSNTCCNILHHLPGYRYIHFSAVCWTLLSNTFVINSKKQVSVILQ